MVAEPRCPHRLSTSLFDLVDQVLEDEEVERQEHVPVEFSVQSTGLIVGLHRKSTLVILWANLKL